jgi:L-lactate permease
MKTTFAAAVILIFGIIVLGLIMALPVQWLWNNALVGAVNGVNPIGFWQSYGLIILSSILFKSSYTSSSNK